MFNIPHQEVTLKTLRKQLPEWSWTAIREGWSYKYRGEKGKETVTIVARGCIDSDYDDVCHTRWYVKETGELFSSFVMKKTS